MLLPHRQSLARRPKWRSTPLNASTSAALAFLLGSTLVSASAPYSPPSSSTPSSTERRTSARIDAIEDGPSWQVSQQRKNEAAEVKSDTLNRRKHVTFQYSDQQSQGASAPNFAQPVDDADSETFASILPTILRHEKPLYADDDMILHPDASAASAASLPRSGSTHSDLLSEAHQYDTQQPASRPSVYNEDLVGKQTRSGYVFVRRTDPSYISGAGAALVTLFSRRDSPVSRPPLVPNSNSRLLIALVIVCILAVGVLTLAAQEMYKRLQSVGQPRSPLRRRSGEGRSTRTLYRSDSSYTSIPASVLSAPTLEEEEERIKTPPTLSRRSSAAASSSVPSPLNENGPNSDDEELERKTQTDLHYLSLPFGIGIGYSYANIADGRDAKTRLSKLAAKRSRSRLGSTLALSTGTLPIPGLSAAANGGDGLRSRSRSFKELCRDAFSSATTTRDIGAIMEEEGGSDMTGVSTPRWGSSSLASLDLSSSGGSGTVTPTGPGGSGTLSTSTGSMTLESLASHGLHAKGRYFGVDSAPATGHTLVDLGQGTPELAVSDPDGITRPASTPGVMPSQVARHPLVEQLRREGRSDTSKRVGKGTPTNAKAF
ncbi:hypothetical protein NDA14_005089 [Ustilago hordei]|nr:hypothetical protein NDA15_007383 [Ustilago hordei]KAJ1578559.1 hypothetical protein NDA12_001923 [Ustilago hordei]KAJ1599246.1 hypothetical protein NDA14_005089 [Ustilago hordei]